MLRGLLSAAACAVLCSCGHTAYVTRPATVGSVTICEIPSKKILKTSKLNAGASSRKIPRTNGGRLACAAMTVKVLEQAGVDIKPTLSTAELYKELLESPAWVLVSDPKPGDVIISPTGYIPKRHGHVGILGEDGHIWSNSSKRRQWDDHFTVEAWERRYKRKWAFRYEG